MSSASIPTEKTPLSTQYGGHHSGTWVDRLPPSWTPYIQLSRLSPPAGLFLIFLPHLFGALHAAITHNLPLSTLLPVTAYLLLGSLFFSNAAHAWNDLVDAPIDAKIERTKTRPIPRGAVSPRAALVFTLSQALAAGVFLLALPKDAHIAAVATVVGTVYYPYAKRHSHFVQFLLGFCLTWGIVVGSAAMGTVRPWRDGSTGCLVGAVGLWVVGFDTIYAHQDLRDDLRVGVRSMAVLVRGWARGFLVGVWVCMSLLLVGSGWFGGMGVAWYVVGVGGVDLEDPASCWAWFSQGFWVTGAAVAAGLLGEYVFQVGGFKVSLYGV
ncbi:UbiA prenyltransferase family-domain-containing protein [Cercophora newfieldiana]|uniref:Diterpenoid pyrone biosynthesis cluster protein C n=1 Tax=Cercophora newfieldiana TaxID=92897 RepID=A0AA39XYF3_9PEZI|nr:UbiA prenyltransferase family-domain-containing protein [Cercophora newfieldiana]